MEPDDGPNWQAEIEELHDCFEAYFAGRLDSLGRVEAVLASNFTIVGPGGQESDRAQTVQSLRSAHGRLADLAIRTSGHRLLFETTEAVMARYVEHHDQPDLTTRRLSTVVFSRDAAAPNGLVWQSVHETWLSD